MATRALGVAMITLGGLPIGPSDDLDRIIALPRRARPTPEEGAALAAGVTRWFRRDRGGMPCNCASLGTECIDTLKPEQAWALLELREERGLLGQIGCGGGKTLAGVLAPLAVDGCRTALLLMPPKLVKQFRRQYVQYAQHFRVPGLRVHGEHAWCAPVAGEPVLHVLPYSALSTASGSRLLENLRPDMVIADECHHLKNPEATRTRRVMRYGVDAERSGLDVAFAFWSGTLTGCSITEYCLDPATRVLTTDLRWNPIGNIRVGDYLIGFDENLHHTKMKHAEVLSVTRVIQPRYRITTNKGTIVCSSDHKWVLKGRARTYAEKKYTQCGLPNKPARWIHTRNLQLGDQLAFYLDPWEIDTSREGGYLAGLLDGEGWVSGRLVAFAQNRGPVLDRFMSECANRGFELSDSEQKGSGGSKSCRRVVFQGAGGGMRALGQLRPIRLLEKAECLWLGRTPNTGCHTQHARVLEISEIPPGEVVAIETSTGTFIAEGFLSHNCHLALLALRERSPLPLSMSEGEHWATAIDPSDWPAPPGALADALCDHGEHVQDGYHRRLVETPGVVVTSAPSSVMRFTVRETEPDGGVPDALTDVMQHVRETWERPDGGEVFETKFLQWACMRNLACGFYYRWVFPRGESDALVREWTARRKAWHRAVREVLEGNRPGLDSPYLVARAAARGLAGMRHSDLEPALDIPAWEPWAEIRDQVHPESQGVRVDDFAARAAARWALEGEPGIVWYDSVELGVWIQEISGLPRFGSGKDVEDQIEQEIRAPRSRSIICSVRAHGTGRDGLQRKYRRQLVTQPFASADGWEQLASRLVRPGQTGEVTLDAWTHTEELGDMLALAEMRAWYVQRTTGTRQKIIDGK